MALLKKILKNSPNEVIVKWTGSGTDTLTMAQLVSTGQTVTGPEAPAAVITGVQLNTTPGSDVTVTRNSEVALIVRDVYDFPGETMRGAVISENSTFSIVVNMVAAGTLILKILKTQGYSIIK